MYKINYGNSNKGITRIIPGKGCFAVLEYDRDVSTNPNSAVTGYFASKMNIKKRQVIARLNNSSIMLQSGAMQMILGNVEMRTNVKGAGDFMKKFIGSKVTGETAVKPIYQGTGEIILEPTYKYILFEDINDWNGAIVLEDGMFLACDSTVEMKVVARNSFSSAALGGEGLFNTSLVGRGVVALESPVPRDELIEVILNNDTLKIDGNQAIAWSNSLQFTVEKSTKSLIGSAASGEGLVNVFRGSGKVLIAPVRINNAIVSAEGSNSGSSTGGTGVDVSSVVDGLFK